MYSVNHIFFKINSLNLFFKTTNIKPLRKILAILLLLSVAYSVSGNPRKYKRGGTVRLQKPYINKRTGKYVRGHYKTQPDNYPYNNLKRKK